jgi:succinate dehydrogenase flavin-adding protein (antitoxin of CptAB toxin-antitoxin module)
MGLSERIKKIRVDFSEDNNLKFAEIMGENPNTTSNWTSGNRKIGKSVLDKVLMKFPQISPTWLLTGEGEMIHSVNQNNIDGDNIQGYNVTVSKTETEKFLDLLKIKDEQLNKSQIQIDKLIGIIERLNNK